MNNPIIPDQLAGFDLGPVLDWLEANQNAVETKLSWLNAPNGSFHLNAEDVEYIQLKAPEIKAILHRFPEAARRRSTLRNIKGMPPHWFRRGMTAQKPQITQDILEALAPRAFVPGHNTPLAWTKEDKIQQIELFHLGRTPLNIARYMAAHTFIHEYTHTLLNPLWFSCGEEYKLKIPNMEEIDGPTFMIKFAVEANAHSAISHYSAAYRPFPTDTSDPMFSYRVNEEFCESVSAYMLGYICCDDPERCFDPFKDRPEVKELVEDFLHAEHVFNI